MNLIRATGATLAASALMLLAAEAGASARQLRPEPGPRLTELTLEQLGDVEVVSVSKQAGEIRRTAVAVHVITREDIRRSGATTIPEVLRLAPGVEVARIDSDHWAVGIRGFSDQFSKSLLVLIDGRSIYTPLWGGMYWPAHDTLMADIERIELIRGPGGTIWGANAVNGVINIITKSAADTRGTLISLGGGSVDRGTAVVRVGGGSDNGLDYRVWAKGVTRGPQFHVDGANYDDWWMAQTGFRTDWSHASGDTVTIQGDLSQGRHGQRVDITTITPPRLTATDGPVDASGVNLLGRWQRNIGATQGVRLQAYYDHTSWLATHFEETRHTVDIDFVHYGTAGRHQLLWGTGLRLSPSRFTPTVPTLDFDPRDQTDRVYSGSFQDEFQVVRDRLWITAGTKLEHNQYTGLEVQPNVRAVWTPHSTQTLWSAVTRAVRTPSRIERAVRATSLVSMGPPVPIFLQVLGNSSFAAERLLGYELGHRMLVTPRVYVDTAVFHNEHDNLGSFGLQTVVIEGSPPTHAVVQFPYVNGVVGRSNGFEVAPEWRPASWAQVKGSYSYIRFDLERTPASIDVNAVSRYEGSSPHHQARVAALLNLPRGIEFDTTYRFVAALPARATDAYHTFDTRLAWGLARGLTASVTAQNLRTPHHVEFGQPAGSSVGIARSVHAALTWSGGSTP